MVHLDHVSGRILQFKLDAAQTRDTDPNRVVVGPTCLMMHETAITDENWNLANNRAIAAHAHGGIVSKRWSVEIYTVYTTNVDEGAFMRRV